VKKSNLLDEMAREVRAEAVRIEAARIEAHRLLLRRKAESARLRRDKKRRNLLEAENGQQSPRGLRAVSDAERIWR
jgi:hypothetical protein